MRSCALLLALLTAPVTIRAQQTAPDSVRFDRLAALGRLWATVKYFHPALAHRPVDWDSALVATIPICKPRFRSHGLRRRGAADARCPRRSLDPPLAKQPAG